MTTRDALLAAVLAHPEDDTPRLLLADHLDEIGEHDRAEFIRAQVALARLPEPEYLTIGSLVPGAHYDYPEGVCNRCRQRSDRCDYHALRQRDKELRGSGHGWDGRTNWVRWAGFAPADPGRASVRFERGFLHTVIVSANEWLAHGDAITASHPVREAILTTHLPAFPRTVTARVPAGIILQIAGREVELTEREILLSRGGEPGEWAERMLAVAMGKRWPGVAFTWPPLRGLLPYDPTEPGIAAPVEM